MHSACFQKSKQSSKSLHPVSKFSCCKKSFFSQSLLVIDQSEACAALVTKNRVGIKELLMGAEDLGLLLVFA